MAMPNLCVGIMASQAACQGDNSAGFAGAANFTDPVGHPVSDGLVR